MRDPGAQGNAPSPLTWVLIGGGLILLGIGLLGFGFGGFLGQGPRPVAPSAPQLLPSPLALRSAEFEQTEGGRVLTVAFVNTDVRPAGVQRVLIDGVEVLTWEARPEVAAPGEDLLLTIRYPFRPGGSYRIAVQDAVSRAQTFVVEAPVLPARLELRRFRLQRASPAEGLEVELELRVVGYERLTLLVEAWAEFAPQAGGEGQEPVYVLTEPLSEEASAYAEALRRWAARLDPPLPVQPLDRGALREWSEARRPGVLVVFTPLQGYRGPVKDALPAELLSPSSGSEAGLPHLRRWLREGLVLLTPTTTHPLRSVLRADGRTQSPTPSAASPGLLLTGKLSTWWSMTAELTREGAAAQALLWGRYQGEYGGVGELAAGELYGYRELVNTFTQGPPEIRGRTLHLYNPFFLRSGRGGWLAFSHNPPSPETLGHDLAFVLVHAPWRGRGVGVEALAPGWTESLDLRGGERRIARRFLLPLSEDGPEDRIVRLLVLAEDVTQEPSRWVWREWLRSLELSSKGAER